MHGAFPRAVSLLDTSPLSSLYSEPTVVRATALFILVLDNGEETLQLLRLCVFYRSVPRREPGAMLSEGSSYVYLSPPNNRVHDCELTVRLLAQGSPSTTNSSLERCVGSFCLRHGIERFRCFCTLTIAVIHLPVF